MTVEGAGPLQGIRVVDLTRLLPGPMCAWYLRGLGASVVKVETPYGGDPLRAVPPFGPDGFGAWFSAINAGVSSVALDLRAQAGKEALDWLLRDADVLLEGFRPGAMARLGLDPQGLRARFPRLVVASISGYGQTGPMREVPGHDLGYLSSTGALAMGAHTAHGVPGVLPVQIADLAGGALSTGMAVVAALYGRDRPGGSGQGQWIDLSMTDATLSLMVPTMAEVAVSQRDPRPGGGLLTGGLPVYRTYKCGCGGYVAFAALEPNFQEAFTRLTGVSLPAAEDTLADFFSRRSRDEWAVLLADACVTPVLRPQEALVSALFRERGRVRGMGVNARVTPPFGWDASFVEAPTPAVGRDTASVLGAAGAPESLIAEVLKW